VDHSNIQSSEDFSKLHSADLVKTLSSEETIVTNSGGFSLKILQSNPWQETREDMPQKYSGGNFDGKLSMTCEHFPPEGNRDPLVGRGSSGNPLEEIRTWVSNNSSRVNCKPFPRGFLPQDRGTPMPLGECEDVVPPRGEATPHGEKQCT